jgi:hypothetical protein
MNRTSNARKQNSAAISHPSLLTDCQIALVITSRLSRTAWPVGRSLTATNAQDQVTSERGGPSPYRAVELFKKKDGSTLRKSDPSVTLSTINPKWSGLGLKASLRSERTVTNCSDHGKGCICMYIT